MDSRNILCIDSSTEQASVALFKDSQFVGEEISLRQRSHSEFVTAAIERLLAGAGMKISEVQQLAVTQGPGSFTGIRVSVGLVKALSYSLKIPIWATDTLTLLRSQLPIERSCFVSLNAYKNLVFGAFFAPGQQQAEPLAYTFESAAQLVREKSWQMPLELVGEGRELFRKLLVSEISQSQVQISALELRPRAKMLGEILVNPSLKPSVYGQTIDWKSLNPLYLRGSEAEENQKIHSSEKK